MKPHINNSFYFKMGAFLLLKASKSNKHHGCLGTRRRFNVDTTLYDIVRRRIDVETTLLSTEEIM